MVSHPQAHRLAICAEYIAKRAILRYDQGREVRATEAKRITLEHYPNAEKSFHIHRVKGSCEAQELHVHDYFQIYYILRGSIRHLIEGTLEKLEKGLA